VRGDGFPGELRDEDAARARTLLEASPPARAVLVDIGDRPAASVRDGATPPELPTSWKLLRFASSGDTTAHLAGYPALAPRCPEHDVPLELRQGDLGP
jgi:hypothetical protein